MTFFKSSKHQRLLWSLLLLSVGAAAGFGLGIFCGAKPPVGCRESDLTPVPDESFVSPASASSVETSPEPEPMPEKWVCLTFDDGPSKTTPDVLSALNRAGVKATFFVVATGNNDKYLPLISEAAAAGHQIALHSASHEYSDIYQSADAYWKDIDLLKERLSPYVRADGLRYLRFPGGSTNTVSRRYGGRGLMQQLKEEVTAKGYAYVDWNVCAEDAVGGKPSAGTIFRNIVRETRRADPVHRADARLGHHPHHCRSPARHHPVVQGQRFRLPHGRAGRPPAHDIAKSPGGPARRQTFRGFGA